jgi:hypothetical protein
MLTHSPSITEVALQLEASAVHLRALSFPEAQRAGQVKSAVDDVNKKLTAVDVQVRKLSSEIQSLRDVTDIRMNAVEAK